MELAQGKLDFVGGLPDCAALAVNFTRVSILCLICVA